MDVDAIDEALHNWYTEHVQHLSQVGNGPGSRYWYVFQGCWYFGYGHFLWSCGLSLGVLICFLCFHLRCHHLHILLGSGTSLFFYVLNVFVCACTLPAFDDESQCLLLCEHLTIVKAQGFSLAAVVPIDRVV